MNSPSATHFLVIDVGTTGQRAAIVDDDVEIVHFEYRSNPPSVPFEGLVEFDAVRLADLVLEASSAGALGRCARTCPNLASRSLGARLLMGPPRTRPQRRLKHPALHERANPMFTGHVALESPRMPSEEGRSRMTPKGPIPRGSRNR